MAPGSCTTGPATEAATTTSADTARQALRGARAETALEVFDLLDGLRSELGCAAGAAHGTLDADALTNLRAFLREAALTLDCIATAHQRLAASLAGHEGDAALSRTRVVRSLGGQVDAWWRAEGMTPPGDTGENV